MSANRFRGLSIPFVVLLLAGFFAGALGVTIAMSVVLLCGTLVVCTDELTKSRA